MPATDATHNLNSRLLPYVARKTIVDVPSSMLSSGAK